MALPRKLKKMDTFIDGVSYGGECKTLTLPKLTRKMEEYRGGSMSGPVKYDLGHEMIEVEHEYGGFMPALMAGWGATTVDATTIQWRGVYQNEQGGTDLVEITVRGRHEEVEGGDGKVGEDTMFKAKTTCAYYRCEVNGKALVELDPINGVEIIDGVDRNAAINDALNS